MLHLMTRVLELDGRVQVGRKEKRQRRKRTQHKHGFSLVAMTIPSRASVIVLILKILLERRCSFLVQRQAGATPVEERHGTSSGVGEAVFPCLVACASPLEQISGLLTTSYHQQAPDSDGQYS